MDLKQDKEDVGGADRVIRNTFNNILNYRKYNK